MFRIVHEIVSNGEGYNIRWTCLCFSRLVQGEPLIDYDGKLYTETLQFSTLREARAKLQELAGN